MTKIIFAILLAVPFVIAPGSAIARGGGHGWHSHFGHMHKHHNCKTSKHHRCKVKK